MMKTTTKNHATTGLFLLVVVGILILLNVLASGLFSRADLTKEGLYSLSKGSKDLMAKLDDKVTATAYFSADLPAPYNQHARYVQDLFEEYAAYSKGHFTFEVKDPGTEETAKNEMMTIGIPPVQIQEIKNDKFEVKQAFLGIVVSYADKKEVLPVIKSVDNLEYELTSAIRKLTTSKLKKIGFLAGHGEPSLQEDLKQALSLIEKNYVTTAVDFSQKKEIPEDVDTLIILTPTKKLEEDELFAIDQFLMKGKSLAFFVGTVQVDLQSFQANNLDHGLDKLMKQYGITLNQNLILDMQNKRIQVASQQGQFRVQNIINYPLIPVLTDFDKSNSLTGRLDSLPLPFACSLDVGSSNADVKVTVLGRSSARSWQMSGMYDINPMKAFQPAADSKIGPFPMMAMAEGKFKSAFADDTGKPFISDPAKVVKKSANARILVVGNGGFLQDKYGDPAGGIFFANAVDWLSQDESLSAIRARLGGEHPITELEPWQKGVIKYGNMIGVPVLFVLFGAFLWSLRRARRRRYQATYNT